MVNDPLKLLYGDQDLSQTGIDHCLARVQACDACNGLLVLKNISADLLLIGPRNNWVGTNVLEHSLEHLPPLRERSLRPLYVCFLRFCDRAIDSFDGGWVDATQGFAGRGAVALYQRGAGNL